MLFKSVSVILNSYSHYASHNGAVPLEADPTTLSIYTVGCKSQVVGDKNPQKRARNFWVGLNSPTGHDTSRLVCI